jgi:hypothetical protein
MENNTTQKTQAQLREEMEAIRCEMIGQYVYLGIFGAPNLNFLSKEDLVKHIDAISLKSQEIKKQYDEKYFEFLNAKS